MVKIDGVAQMVVVLTHKKREIFCRKPPPKKNPRHLTLTLTFFVNHGTVSAAVLKTWRGLSTKDPKRGVWW